MKAAVLLGNENIQYIDIAEPKTLPGTVKVKVAICGICGSDVPRVLYNGAHSYPIVLGHEFSGTIYEVGEGVKGIKIGDHVAVAPLVPCNECSDCRQGNFSLCSHYSFIGSRQQGAFADYVVVPAENAVVIDPSIPFDQAATFEPSTVALHGLFQNNYKGGGTVAVLGCGIIGLFTIQWAKIFGAKKVVAIGRGKKGLDTALMLGADDVLSTADPDFDRKLDALENGRGFDFVFESSGSSQTMYLAFKTAAKKAHVCLIGTPSDSLNFTKAMWEQLNRKEFFLTGSWMSYSAPFPGCEWDLTAHCFSDGRLKFVPDMIHGRFHMSEAAKAFSLFKEQGAVKGRILLYNQ